MKKLLVTGASGFLGWNVFQAQPERWRLIGTWHRHSDGIPPGSEHVQLDLCQKDQVWHLLKALDPDAVFHLAAHSDTNYCEEHPEETRALNVEAAGNLAEMCAERHIRFFFTSSEQVFDGTKERYFETDEPNPQNQYGWQKWEAERLIREAHPAAVILRVSVMYGWSNAARPSFLQQWLNAWMHFIPVRAFYDEFRSFLGACSASMALFHLLEQDASGLFHLGGDVGLSRYDLAIRVKESFKLDHASIEICSRSEVPMPAYRPARLVLDNSLLASTGFKPLSLDEELGRLAKEHCLPPPFSEN
ncbi:MAG: NAD(P)-dependent oxidoreductase [Saprospiraceae bacterium]|nr:MAG: NAD(P)-dependent oxidoreductase [Saprospiraceae bacterium]